jgi:hypothetical protein
VSVATDDRSRRNVRLALWLGLVAFAFFLSFIVLAVTRGL